MLVTETTGIKLLPKIIVLNPKDGIFSKFFLEKVLKTSRVLW